MRVRGGEIIFGCTWVCVCVCASVQTESVKMLSGSNETVQVAISWKKPRLVRFGRALGSALRKLPL